MLMPEKLKKGDTIAVVAPSDCIEEEDLETINQSILLMEGSGFSITFGNYAFSNTLGYSSSAKEKAEDINQMFLNPEVKAIFWAAGGFNSNSALEYLDYESIKKHPKIVCGFSDATSILNVITQKTGLVTFHGPTFKSLTSWATAYAYEQVMKRFVEGKTALREPEDEFSVIQEGTAQGSLIGGNLSLIKDLVAGKYAVHFQDKILFIEELSLESPPALVSHHLYHLKQNGVFDKIKGMWIGNYDGSVALEKIVLDVLEGEYSFPIIKSNNFGHTEKKMVIPIGTRAKIDTTKEEKISLLEDCVK